MNSGSSSERPQDESPCRYGNTYNEETTKSRSPVMSSHMFTFNSQEVLTLDLETDEFAVEVSNICDRCKYDDHEEKTKEWSVYLNRGCKRTMEDRFKIVSNNKNKTFFFGIYDGHGTEQIADLLAQRLDEYLLGCPSFESDPINSIINSFLKLDYEILESQIENCKNIGSVAICCIIINETLYVVNLGDSRAVLVDHKGEAKSLSNEHVPSREDERQRIEKLGGVVLLVHDQERIMGELGVSRAFGDKFYKPFVSAIPEIFTYALNKEDHKYLILASDGLWNEMSNNDLETLLKERDGEENLAKAIYEGVLEKKSFFMDNTCIITVDVERVLDYIMS